MVVQKLCLEEELTNFTASSMVHPSFEGLPSTFTDALSKDEGQAFLFFGIVKVHAIVFKEVLLCAQKIIALLGIMTSDLYHCCKYYLL